MKIQKRSLEAGTIARVTAPVSSACIYAACKELRIPRSLAEVSKASGVDKHAIARWYRRIGSSHSKDSGDFRDGDDIKVGISRICNSLAVTEKTKRRALMILERLRDGAIAPGRNPDSVAAGIVYFACVLEAESVSAKEVGAKANVGRDALFQTLKEIRKRRTMEALLS